jgi:hypothetical protein
MQRLVSFFEEIRKRSDTDFSVEYRGNLVFGDGKGTPLPLALREGTARIFFEDPDSAHAMLYTFLVEKELNEHLESSGLAEDLSVYLDGGMASDTLKEYVDSRENLHLILIETANAAEHLALLQEVHDDGETVVSPLRGCLVVLGAFEDAEEEARSLQSSILENFLEEVAAGYSDVVRDLGCLRDSYGKILDTLETAKTYLGKCPPLYEDELVFESLIRGIDHDRREKVFKAYQNIFQKLDRDIILTIEEFIRSDLSLSRTAAKLYIHRNTLTYRLDRIEKEFSLDIRKFKDAIIIYTALLTWKEKRTNEN